MDNFESSGVEALRFLLTKLERGAGQLDARSFEGLSKEEAIALTGAAAMVARLAGITRDLGNIYLGKTYGIALAREQPGPGQRRL